MRTLLAMLVACGPRDKADTDSGPSSTDDSGEDTAVEVSFSDISATLSEDIPTVVKVSFKSNGEGTGYVRFGEEGSEGFTATASAGEDGSWSATLVGLPAETEAWFQVGIGDAASDLQAVSTGPAPAWVTGLSSSSGDPTPGFLVTGLMATGHGAVILDTRGRPVWWWEAPDGLVGALHTSARLSPDRQTVWFNAFALATPGDGLDGQNALVGVAIDGSAETVIDAPYTHHDLVVHEDGTLAWIDVDQREVDGEIIRGDRLVERAPDGTESALWSSWDTFSYSPDAELEPPPWWTLCNHLEWVPERDAYVISTRNLSALAQVQRGTGAVDWVLGAEGTLVPDREFHGQHGFTVLDDGVLLFDNGPSERRASHVVRYAFDAEAGTATATWAYEADPALYSFVMGDAVRLPNGDVIAVYSTAATVVEVDETGVEVARFTYSPGTFLGFMQYWDSLVE